MSDKQKLSPLPRCTAKYITNPDDMSEAAIRGMVSNPVYAGVPPYQRMVSDEVWIRSAARLIEEEGAEQFLVNLLYVLRNSMVSAVPEIAIPSDYDGPWPDDEDVEIDLTDPNPETSSPWHYPMEGFIFCTHDDTPMIMLDGEFICVSEFLFAHLGDSCVSDLLNTPILTLVFQNGHTLPLLCPDCGESLHVADTDELLDTLNGLAITAVIWDDELEELILEFASPGDLDWQEEPLETLLIHLDSVRRLTCPQQQIWPDEGEL